MGFTCTAFIPEEDASKFLYWYPSGSLADVMDKEVRGRIQQAAAEVAAKYPLDSLRIAKTGNRRRGEADCDELLRRAWRDDHYGRDVWRDDV